VLDAGIAYYRHVNDQHPMQLGHDHVDVQFAGRAGRQCDGDEHRIVPLDDG
jgi:hypothetical protein